MKIIVLIICCMNLYAEVKNPYQIVWDEEEGSASGMQRFLLDINGDKNDEIFVGAVATFGNGGGQFHVFKKIDNGYMKLGELFLHPSAVSLSTVSNSEMKIIRTYRRFSAFEGEIASWQSQNNKFIKIESKMISSNNMHKYLSPLSIKVERTKTFTEWK